MKRRRDERGFAMLLVFLMAALIALSLYNEIPRVSFESQRAKEQLLIERGEQYKRGIQVFVRANKKYPSSIQELESFNNHRYLRKQYVDPMTGKKEWRLVHIGPGGVFTDSLVNKPKGDKDKDKKSDGSTTTTTQNYIDPNNPNGQQGPSAVPPRRQSEMAGAPGQPGFGTTQPPQIDPATGQPIQQPGVQPGQPGMPGTVPGVPGTGYPTGYPTGTMQPGQTYPGQPYTGQPYTGQPGQVVPGQTYPSGYQPGMPVQPGQPGQVIPGQPYTGQPYTGQPYTGQPYTGQPGQPYTPPYPGQPGAVPGQPGVQPYPYSTQPGAQGPGTTPFQQPGTQPVMPGAGPAAPPNSAQQMINDMLTRPRSGVSNPTGTPVGQQIGGGIAGVASTAEAEGIKVYNDKTNYKEWEFIYDYTKDKGPGMAAQQQTAPGTPVNQLGTAPGQTPTTPLTPATQLNPFGAAPGAGPGAIMQPPRQ